MDTHALNLDHPASYRICAQGAFDAYWLDMLSGVWVIAGQTEARTGVTTLVGQVTDQAALLGVLEQLCCLGLPLVAVEYLAEDEKATM